MTSGAVGWNMPVIPVGDGESWQSLNARAQQRVTANVPATANEIQVSWFPVITPKSASSGDAFRVMLSRLGSDAADTLSGDAVVYGVALPLSP